MMGRGKTQRAFAHLVTLRHAALAEPVRSCDWPGGLISKGRTFPFVKFQVGLPGESTLEPEHAGLVDLIVDPLFERVLRACLGSHGELTGTIELVNPKQPDRVLLAAPARLILPPKNALGEVA